MRILRVCLIPSLCRYNDVFVSLSGRYLFMILFNVDEFFCNCKEEKVKMLVMRLVTEITRK